MKIVLQRVRRATVDVDTGSGFETVGQIADGFLLLLGVRHGDTKQDADWLVEKILKLKLFASDGSQSFMDQSIVEAGGAILIVSQFTLYGDCRKGTKPSFTDAAPPEQAKELYEYVVQQFIDSQLHVESGTFGAHMEVDLVNDGPITLILDTDRSQA